MRKTEMFFHKWKQRCQGSETNKLIWYNELFKILTNLCTHAICTYTILSLKDTKLATKYLLTKLIDVVRAFQVTGIDCIPT